MRRQQVLLDDAAEDEAQDQRRPWPSELLHREAQDGKPQDDGDRRPVAGILKRGKECQGYDDGAQQRVRDPGELGQLARPQHSHHCQQGIAQHQGDHDQGHDVTVLG